MNPLASARNVVVKIGSSLIAREDGAVRQSWLDALATDVCALRVENKRVTVVSSGAVAIGRRALGLTRSAIKLEDKQAAAAVGQIRLAQAWSTALGAHGAQAAQILLTQDDTENRRRYLNARSTLRALAKIDAVPVINENDTIATREIRFGDNDRLAARVAVMISADLLVLLSDVDGLYTADPGRDPSAEHIAHVDAIDDGVRAMAGGVASDVGSGGMITKLAAAQIAARAGCSTVLASGREHGALGALAAGARHTRFAARGQPERARKEWIAASLGAMGVVTIDAGAARALASGKSLLPAGVIAVEGAFGRGDAILVRGPDGSDLAKGLSAYDAADARRIIGCKSAEIVRILGYRLRDELVHRDDLALL